jgi:hypothetical protein
MEIYIKFAEPSSDRKVFAGSLKILFKRKARNDIAKNAKLKCC